MEVSWKTVTRDTAKHTLTGNNHEKSKKVPNTIDFRLNQKRRFFILWITEWTTAEIKKAAHFPCVLKIWEITKVPNAFIIYGLLGDLALLKGPFLRAYPPHKASSFSLGEWYFIQIVCRVPGWQRRTYCSTAVVVFSWCPEFAFFLSSSNLHFEVKHLGCGVFAANIL